MEQQWGCQPWARRLSPLSPPWKYWSRIRKWIVRNFQILIVSAVKICKQCLQTASASGSLHSPADSLTGHRPWIPDPWAIAAKWKFLVLPLGNSRKQTYWQRRLSWKVAVDKFSSQLKTFDLINIGVGHHRLSTSRVVNFLEILTKAWKLKPYNRHSNSVIFLGPC